MRWGVGYLLVLTCFQLASCQEPRKDRPAEVLLREYFLVKLKGTRIGTYSRIIQRTPSGQIESNISFDISVKRFNQALSVTRHLVIQENEAGQIDSFEMRLSQSADPIVIRGSRTNGNFRVTQTGAGPRVQNTSVIPPDLLGPWKTELKQRSLGFAEGTQYRITVLNPTAIDALFESYEIKLTGKRKFVLGNQETEVAVMRANTIPAGAEELTFLSNEGNILYQEVAGYSMERSDEPTSRANYSSSEVIDLLLVKPEGRLENPRFRFEAEFSVTSDQGAPSIEASPYQTVKVDGKTLAVRIKVPEPTGKITFAAQDPYVQPDFYITSKDPNIVRLARAAVGNEKDPWKQVEILSRWVYTSVKKKDSSVGYATASEVARDLTGDCTEHSVLFAALARSLGIPTRIVTGLVYLDSAAGSAMIFHQWVEVRFATWIPVDPTFGLARADAGRIVIAPVSSASQAEMKRAERAIIEWCNGVRVKVISE
ncbi:MAG: transglutaminase family protein [Leptospirales bacterium]|nr:transglutaminase family protein [Leptospirales bacterium]